MKYEIKINDDIKLIMTKNEFGYLEVLEAMSKAKFIRIVTYNISEESKELIGILEEINDDKNIIIVTNIPSRFNRYTSEYAKKRANQSISRYKKILNPDNYAANIRTFFNFDNHSKIVMTDSIAYIGSANFSDESKNNNECGIIIKDKNIIKDIDDVFIRMQVDESIEYYSNSFTNVFITITNLLNKSHRYCNEYYWSFFTVGYHEEKMEYNGCSADLSPILVEEIESLSYEIEQFIHDLRSEEIYHDILNKLDLGICEQIRYYFGVNSDLEEFSRFNLEETTQELFQEYLLRSDPDDIDGAAQQAMDEASIIQSNRIDEIHIKSLEGLDVLRNLNSFIEDLFNKIERKKQVNECIDNTNKINLW